MIKNNIKLLDIDEHQRAVREACLPKDLKEFCKKYDLILDLATSDVCLYIEDQTGRSIGIK